MPFAHLEKEVLDQMQMGSPKFTKVTVSGAKKDWFYFGVTE
jgi:hypothetical protein